MPKKIQKRRRRKAVDHSEWLKQKDVDKKKEDEMVDAKEPEKEVKAEDMKIEKISEEDSDVEDNVEKKINRNKTGETKKRERKIKAAIIRKEKQQTKGTSA